MDEAQNETQQAAGAEQVGSSPAAKDELSQLQADLAAAQARAEENFRSWQRAAADFANFKRRADEEKKFGERWLIEELLPLVDDFERAWGTLPRDLLRLTWIEGVYQVYGKLHAVLERHGVTPIDAENASFNPLEHEAVMHEDGDLAEQTRVVAVLQRGYRLHDRLLRAALVKVGRAMPASATPPAAGGVPPADPEASATV
ncbi:MAG: nucleotide exchange factor GrpE [Chloroflexi bacterium]|nr:nucleotide exchange factor GrpE [Chloroflexota bacterium]